MNKTLKFIAITIVMLGGLLAVWANGVVKPAIENTVGSESSEAAAAAPKLYVSNCARCHGADGKGNTQLGREYDTPDLTVSAKQMSLAKVKSVISKGDGDMPAFGKKLKAADITMLANYVRGL